MSRIYYTRGYQRLIDCRIKEDLSQVGWTRIFFAHYFSIGLHFHLIKKQTLFNCTTVLWNALNGGHEKGVPTLPVYLFKKADP